MTTQDPQSADQVVQQAAQAAAQAAQDVKQAAQTIQEASRGAGSEATRTIIDSEVLGAGLHLGWGANVKRTYDEFQAVALDAARRSQQDFDSIRNVSLQALQNAVETANMIAKQAVAHRDIAIDREWNVDEVSTLTAKSGVQADSLVTVLASAIAKALAEEKGV